MDLGEPFVVPIFSRLLFWREEFLLFSVFFSCSFWSQLKLPQQKNYFSFAFWYLVYNAAKHHSRRKTASLLEKPCVTVGKNLPHSWRQPASLLEKIYNLDIALLLETLIRKTIFESIFSNLIFCSLVYNSLIAWPILSFK